MRIRRKSTQELERQVLGFLFRDRFNSRTPQEIVDDRTFGVKTSVRKVAMACDRLYHLGLLSREDGKLLANSHFGIAQGKFNEIARILQESSDS